MPQYAVPATIQGFPMTVRFADAILNSLIATIVLLGLFLLGLAVGICLLPYGPLP